MDFSFLGNFANRLGNNSFLIDSNMAFELFKLKTDVANIKHDVLLTLVSIDIHNRNDYLDYIISELGTFYEHEPDVSSVEKWLKKYNVTIESILNGSITNSQFKKIINTNFEFHPALGEAEEINSIQTAFYLYFSKLFGHDLIKFLRSKKNKIENSNDNIVIDDSGKIKWIGKPSQLGYIIRQLADLGYIEAPLRSNGEINYTQFAKNIRATFDIDSTDDTLIKYLNFDSEKSQSIIRKFSENGFNIPHKNRIS